ncbi:pheromone binding protein 2 [Danaus plexippus plexippus]|uniref:Pheromone binding protein 2 n=1 Tax=Danaus plexippus plexippus TaxID=278856 RepID=A0A212F2E5_DANPL|nr:pheromone binding protein 2 [Danaus plexippus plexippus]
MALFCWRLLFAAGVLSLAQGTLASQEIMKKLTTGFVKAMEECKAELNLGDHIIQDFMNYWREEYELLNRDTGCAIMCMASKHDLITEDMKIHHENAHEFAKSHGADDDLAKQLVQMIHDCEKQFTDITDDCSKTLEISKCFRTKIHELKWAPSMETILEELMTET